MNKLWGSIRNMVDNFHDFLRGLYSDKYLKWSLSIPSKLYHYTSYQSAISILKSQTLYLTHTETKNDSTEVSVCIEALMPILKDKILNSNGVEKKIHTTISQKVEKYYYLYSPFKKEFTEDTLEKNFYSFSLSEKEDNLCQWLHYGDRTRGVCICFDFSKIFSKSGLISPSSCQWQIRFGRVEYDTSSSEFDQIVFDHLEYIVSYILQNSSDSNIDLYSGYIIEKLINQVSLYKHLSFNEEREWKLFHILDKCNFGRLTNPDKEKKVFEFQLSGQEKLPITDFKLGTNNLEKENVVANLLEEYGYRDILSKSKIPYRLK